MRRLALQDTIRRDMGGTAAPVHLAAPVKGWNTRDPIAAMDPLYAITLDNLFPVQGEVQLRTGYIPWITGANGDIKSLAMYNPKSGINDLFACTDDGIYYASITGTVSTPLAALTDGFWDSVNFNNSAGDSFLWGCNGVDKPWVYNGTTWTALDDMSVPAITGVTSTSLISPWVFKRRIFVIEKNTMNAWFLPVDSIAGEAHKLPIGGLFRRGGSLVAGTSWTVDGGDGADDLCVFITSEGEAAVYKGSNPNSAADWSLVGVYFVGRPANRRCFQKLGADVAVLTEIGLLPLSKALTAGELNLAAALSDPIRPSITEAMSFYFTSPGWQIHLHPIKSALMLNIPQGNDTFVQFVMNTITGAWCSFSGWNALCFATMDGELYMGLPDGVVAKAWTSEGDGDNGSDIVGSAQTAFTTFGRPGQIKKLMQFRPLLLLDDAIRISWGFVSDYRRPRITSQYDSAAGLFSYWDIALWDVSPWASERARLVRWLTASSIEGYAVSVLLQMTSRRATVSWSGTDYLLNAGGLV